MTKVPLHVLMLILAMSLPMFAQTTLTMPTAYFLCDAASAHPVTSFYQFQCRGIKLDNPSGTLIGSFFWFTNGIVEVNLPVIPGQDVYDSSLTLDSFTEPSANGPGTFRFSWRVEDGNGVYHSGTASGSWVDYVICGGRGCYWHAPKLLSFSTTAN